MQNGAFKTQDLSLGAEWMSGVRVWSTRARSSWGKGHFWVYPSGSREVDLELPVQSKEKSLQCTSLQSWANLNGFPLHPLALPQEFFLSAESSDIALLPGPNFIPWAAS